MASDERTLESGSRDVRVLADAPAVTRAASDLFVEFVRAAVAARGRAFVALSGGSTPRKLYEALVVAPLDWSKVLFFFGDERCVSPEHADSNYRMAREALLARIHIPLENVHRIYAEIDDKDAAAVEYERELMRVFALEPGELPRFDLVLLGLGPDGHTASLFPGSTALGETTKLVAATWVESLKVERVTLTAQTINAARNVAFLVEGAGKAEVLRDVLQGPRDTDRLPSQLIAPTDGKLVFLVDRAAAASLAP